MNRSQINHYTIDFEPVGKRIILSSDKTIMDGALLAGLDLITSCNGLGICASCKIQVISGKSSKQTAEEIEMLSPLEIGENIRLACQTKPQEDMRIFIHPGSLMHGQQLQIEGKQNQIIFDPPLKAIDLIIPQIQNGDSLSLWQHLQNAVNPHGVYLEATSLPVVQALPQAIWNNQSGLRVIYDQKNLVSILSRGKGFYGIGLDIGSTKIATYWVDLETGATILQTGMMNPQIPFGEDVINRITYANLSYQHQKQLQEVLQNTINSHIQETCQLLRIDRSQLVDMVIVGNTAIHHLFCGIPVRSLGEAPYSAVINESLHFPANEVNLAIAEGARIYIPPIIAGYVGADHIAALTATRFNEFRGTACLIDVGTNTEISLIHNQIIRTCSCASGPAFEGAHIHDGMRAAPGAIEKVKICGGEVEISTIGAQKPVGICGSGILSAIAEMRKNDLIDRRGVFQRQHPLVKQSGNQPFFILADRNATGAQHAIHINRQDVHEIQLAKAAIRTGIEMLCQYAGIKPSQIDQFLIAGAFGTHLDVESAITIGMFPDVNLERYSQIGNAAGVGAREMLVNQQMRKTAEILATQIEYVELTTQAEFQDVYVKALALENNDDLSQIL